MHGHEVVDKFLVLHKHGFGRKIMENEELMDVKFLTICKDDFLR